MRLDLRLTWTIHDALSSLGVIDSISPLVSYYCMNTSIGHQSHHIQQSSQRIANQQAKSQIQIHHSAQVVPDINRDRALVTPWLETLKREVMIVKDAMQRRGKKETKTKRFQDPHSCTRAVKRSFIVRELGYAVVQEVRFLTVRTRGRRTAECNRFGLSFRFLL
jgi:hypothetical protein